MGRIVAWFAPCLSKKKGGLTSINNRCYYILFTALIIMAEACGETSSPPGLMVVAQLPKTSEDVPFGWESLADPNI